MKISALLTCVLGVALAQTPTNAPAVTIHVGDKPAITMTAEDFAKLPRHSVTVAEHGKTAAYEGVLLHDVLERAGAPLGSELKGKALASYVLATGKDGYQVVYTLAELDPAFTDTDILVADKSGGEPLTESQGPFRIVVPHDKKAARSLRMLERIDVVELRK